MAEQDDSVAQPTADAATIDTTDAPTPTIEPETELSDDGALVPEEIELIDEVSFTITDAPDAPVQLGINGKMNTFAVGKPITMHKDRAATVLAAFDDAGIVYELGS